MIKQIFTLLFLTLSISVFSQKVWNSSSVSSFRQVSVEDQFILPTEYLAYKLDINTLQSSLINTPLESTKRNGTSGKLVSLPLPDGSFEDFMVYESPVMAEKLSAKYPNIKSYKGVSINDPGTNVRFDFGRSGFHAAIHTPHEVFYIDPFSRTSTSEYVVYDVQDHLKVLNIDAPLCGTEDSFKDIPHVGESSRRMENIPLRVYRFALACTGEWGQLRTDAEDALSDMNTGVNRLNQIFENELAMRLVLIDENDQLLHFDPETDPYFVTTSGGAMLQANTGVINNAVGFNGYDLGHVYSTSCDVGGIASLGSMCNGNKGAGVTCHYSNNLDFMAASVTSHEIGHQMSAQHTFNNCDGDNESLGNGYEPGSGSTIMSYGGLCGPQKNIQGGSDDYYHVASLIQIYNHLRDGGAPEGCAQIIETDNIEPEVFIDTEPDFYIPENTYFYLEGRATDANNDNLTYSWEGFNAGPLSPLGDPIGTAPRFRSFPPSDSPIRYIPKVFNILSKTSDRTEVLPAGEMELNFMFTVRDNNAEAGTAVWEELRFFSAPTDGKFEVTSQNSLTSVELGDSLIVTWNVAGTDQAPINCKNVDILFNTASEANFDINAMTVLADNVPNNGTAKVIVPNEVTNRGRIIVRASENIFFDINSRNIQVKEPETPSVFFETTPSFASICLPDLPTVKLKTLGFAGIEGDVDFSVIGGLPDDVLVTFDNPSVAIGDSTTVSFDFTDVPNSATYEIEIQAIVEGVDTFSRPVTLFITDTDHSSLTGVLPQDGQAGLQPLPEFAWTPSFNATSYGIEIATSPAFGSSVIESEEGINDTFYEIENLLDVSTVYYWRVIPSNLCGTGNPSPVYAFSTEALTCNQFSPAADVLPINITQSGTPTIEAPIEISSPGTIADVNVVALTGEHARNKDLITTLISPSGTEVDLYRKICNQSDFNVGFDDAAAKTVQCPVNTGLVYRPFDLLANFNGEDMQGTWILRIQDTEPGNSGKFEAVTIEICSNQALNNPYLTNNNLLKMVPNEIAYLTPNKLQTSDDNNSDDELIYTLVEVPAVGELKLNGTLLNVGDQFTQEQINDGRIQYNAANNSYDTDFSFTVIDGEGGWVGITHFEINVDEINSSYDPIVDASILITPNPNNGLFTIDVSQAKTSFDEVSVYNAYGQLVKNYTNPSNLTSIDLQTAAEGVYYVKFRNENYLITKQVLVVR